ncbi:hypothetical protein BUALT_Bualt10G0002400 [Buddleja alternifolia]|uniref:Uncharacterized protein n=1 Tax=Buddleja alternifolia TaxID=168488 RepID=A0AAV6WVQ5_9LAMI|nr:hypothetical protein BUALT_Bualt10G0002400 [Buddleja alternifolia]
MKATCTLIASVVAASTVAFTSGDRDVTFSPKGGKGKCVKSSSGVVEKEKYAPKLDHGLRFIETLVTAHSLASMLSARGTSLSAEHFNTSESGSIESDPPISEPWESTQLS